MLSSRRSRTLSDEGLTLFNLAHVPRSKLSGILHNLFWSDYDQRLKDVLERCHESAIALIKHWNSEVNRNETPKGSTAKKLNSGVRNAVRLILAPTEDDHLGTKRHRHQVQQNYLFYNDVMKHAFQAGDHQSSMLYYLALTHACVARLRLKRPKRMDAVLRNIETAHGSAKTGYAEHIRHLLYTGFSEKFVPSIIAMSMYKNKNEVMYENMYENKAYSANTEKVKDLLEIIEIYGYIYYFIAYNNIPLYEDKGVVETDLFELSHCVHPPVGKEHKKSRWSRLLKTLQKKKKDKELKDADTKTDTNTDTDTDTELEFEFINPMWNHPNFNQK